ncbi:MAG: hypothetical protein JO133_07445 [Burkholderiaceae bacterium]|nr:hypothetical protein [Burkholderiaceae bacterium]
MNRRSASDAGALLIEQLAHDCRHPLPQRFVRHGVRGMPLGEQLLDSRSLLANSAKAVLQPLELMLAARSGKLVGRWKIQRDLQLDQQRLARLSSFGQSAGIDLAGQGLLAGQGFEVGAVRIPLQCVDALLGLSLQLAGACFELVF